jgi:predicted transcriptional regulator
MNHSVRFQELEVSVTVKGADPGDGTADPITEDDSSPFVPAVTIILTAAIAVAWGIETSKVSLLGLGLPLYTKLRKERVMDDFTRGRIFGYIGANPGEHFNAIKRALDLPNGTFAHHLNVLEREGYIKSQTDGMFKRYYPMDMKVPTSEGGLKRTQVLILEVVGESPGISQREIASVLGLSSSTIGYHMKDLLHEGYIKKERRGIGVRYYLISEPIS